MRALIYLWILLWGLDRAIFWITEAAWFGSVGQGQWFNARFLAQFGLFWGTFFLALISAAGVMRVAARPLPEAQNVTLPRALEKLEPLRRGAARLAWLVLIVGAWSVARQIAGGWPLVLAALSGASSPFGVVWRLPLLQLAGAGIFKWLLIMLGAGAFAGVLRALPLLARREPQTPRKLWRILGVLGALTLLARGALDLVWATAATASDGTTGGELFLGWPLAVLGALLCVGAALQCLRRPGYKRLGVAVALAIVAPPLLRALLSPLALVLAAPKNVVASNVAATRAGWNLGDVPAIDRAAPPLAAHWPIWNEAALLGVARGEFGHYKGQVVDWRAAFTQNTIGVVVGVPAALENWGSRHEAEPETALNWLALDAAKNVGGTAPEIVDAPLPLRSYYGVEGTPLAGNAPVDAGVPFGNWGWKVAWVWRLRDPLLLLDGARASRLLVFRGARESAQRLAPFLVWDEPKLRPAPQGARWQVVGYAATPFFGGARAASQGEFAGFNAAAPAAIAQVDPQNGSVEFFAPPNGAKWSAGWAKVLDAHTGTAPLQTPLLSGAQAEMARASGARDVLGEPVWTWSAGRGQSVLRASNWPPNIETRLAALDASARRDWGNVEDKMLDSGEALLWPDTRAPGGFWVGRPYYSSAASGGGPLRQTQLWRVQLTAIAASSPVVAGADARAALLEFALQTKPAKTSQALAPGEAPLALEALRAHDAAQKAASASNWGEWAKQSARERQLLEALAARRERP